MRCQQAVVIFKGNKEFANGLVLQQYRNFLYYQLSISHCDDTTKVYLYNVSKKELCHRSDAHIRYLDNMTIVSEKTKLNA